MSISLTFTLEEAEILFYSGTAASDFRDERAVGRFVPANRSGSEEVMLELILASPQFDNGSMLWCASAGDALLLKKIHEAYGYEAYILGDQAADSEREYYTVLTSWNIYGDIADLTEDPIVAELMVSGSLEPGHPGPDGVREWLHEQEVEILGEPEVEDHQDHFHSTLLLKCPGTKLQLLASGLSDLTHATVGYKVVSTEA